jgi:hypothetical protein
LKVMKAFHLNPIRERIGYNENSQAQHKVINSSFS